MLQRGAPRRHGTRARRRQCGGAPAPLPVATLTLSPICPVPVIIPAPVKPLPHPDPKPGASPNPSPQSRRRLNGAGRHAPQLCAAFGRCSKAVQLVCTLAVPRCSHRGRSGAHLPPAPAHHPPAPPPLAKGCAALGTVVGSIRTSRLAPLALGLPPPPPPPPPPPTPTPTSTHRPCALGSPVVRPWQRP